MMRLQHLDLGLVALHHATKRRNWDNNQQANDLTRHDRGQAHLDLIVLYANDHVDELEAVRAPHHECQTNEEVAEAGVNSEHIEDGKDELAQEVNEAEHEQKCELRQGIDRHDESEGPNYNAANLLNQLHDGFVLLVGLAGSDVRFFTIVVFLLIFLDQMGRIFLVFILALVFGLVDLCVFVIFI